MISDKIASIVFTDHAKVRRFIKEFCEYNMNAGSEETASALTVLMAAHVELTLTLTVIAIERGDIQQAKAFCDDQIKEFKKVLMEGMHSVLKSRGLPNPWSVNYQLFNDLLKELEDEEDGD